jgi:RNA polymerase sigma-70 factor, ECF subfamily
MNVIQNDQQDKQDLSQLAAGHHDALNSLIDRHGARLYRYLIRQLSNADDAAEVAQETFVRVYQNSAKYQSQRGRFSTWLYTIATNLAHDRLRQRYRQKKVFRDLESNDQETSIRELVADPKPNPHKRFESAECIQEVSQAIAGLPEKLRTPLILAAYEDKTHSEISTILRCSPKAVETRIYRARKLLGIQLRHYLSSSD